MDLEAPVDAWYVWLAVSVVSVALAGVAIGLPTAPPPDANRAANAIERVSGSSLEASGSYAHDADAVVVDGTTIELENEHGTARASIDYGVVVPVNGSGRLAALARGAPFEEAYDAEIANPETDAVETFLAEVATAYDENSGERLPASDELAVRKVAVDPATGGVEPRREEATLRVTGTSDNGNVRQVTLAYDGPADRAVELELDGTYTTGTDLSHADSRTGAGEIEIGEIRSPLMGWAGDPPLEYDVTFEGGTWAGKPIEDRSWTGELPVRETRRWGHEIDRAADHDADAPYVDHDAETDRYHVTLVTV